MKERITSRFGDNQLSDMKIRMKLFVIYDPAEKAGRSVRHAKNIHFFTCLYNFKEWLGSYEHPTQRVTAKGALRRDLFHARYQRP